MFILWQQTKKNLEDDYNQLYAIKSTFIPVTLPNMIKEKLSEPLELLPKEKKKRRWKAHRPAPPA